MANKKRPKEKEEALEIRFKTDLNTIWVDNMNVAMRKDGVCLIRFLSQLPEALVEQVQIMTSKENVKNFINALCDVTKYYPSDKQVVEKTKEEK